MDIVLLGNKTIYTLKLPSRIEGSFFLIDPITQDNLIVVEANGPTWGIHSSSDAKILQLDGTEIKETNITYGDFYIIEYKGRKNVMYCDFRYDESFKLYQVLGDGSIKFGSQSTCQIICNNPYFKEFHFELTYNSGSWKITADKSAFVYVNGGLSNKEALI